jgi:hypothetical protein
MKSIKLHADTVSLLRAYCHRSGKTYDGVITDLIRHQQKEGEAVLAAADRLRRIEEMILRLVDAPGAENVKPTFTI